MFETSNPHLSPPFWPLNSDHLPMAATHLTTTPAWNYTKRAISIDRKTFSIAFDLNFHGSKAKIKESNKTSSHSLSLTWNSLSWLVTSFKRLVDEPCSYKFFSEQRNEDYVIWLEKLKNRHGYFAEINQLSSNGGKSRLVIPLDKEKSGWFSFFSLISEYPGEAHKKKSSTFKDILVSTQTNSHKSCIFPSHTTTTGDYWLIHHSGIS